MFRHALAAAMVLAMSASAASALVFTFTEGDNQNRKLVAGSVDLEDAPGSPGAFDLGSGLLMDDVVQLHGRIVSATDLFTVSFSSAVDFRIDFDLDGYNLEAGGFEANSGLVGQRTRGGDPTPGLDTKGVRFSLDGNGSVLTKDFTTDVLAANTLDSLIFFGVGGEDYLLTVDGSVGPNTGIAALYDLKISAVPLPAALPLFLTALLGFGIFGRFRKGQTA